METWACGYTDNSVEGFASPIICNLEAGCKRWHDFHLRKDPDYKEISYNLNKKMFNINLPKNLEVSHLSGEGVIKKKNKVARYPQCNSGKMNLIFTPQSVKAGAIEKMLCLLATSTS